MKNRIPAFILASFVVWAVPLYGQKGKLPDIFTHSSVSKVSRVSSPAVVRTVTLPRALAIQPVTGRELLQLAPGWQKALSHKFTVPELQTIEKAFFKTDLAFFEEKDGLVTPVTQEWNYTARFTQELEKLLDARGQTFSAPQWKQLFGGTGVKGATLSNYFKLLSLETWLLTHGGEWPRRQFSQNGRVLKKQELSPEQLAEQQLANGIKWAVANTKDAQDPVLLQLKERYEQLSRKKTAADWLDELKIWLASNNGEYPRSTFSVNGKKLSAAEYTPEQKAEVALANGVTNAITLAKDLSDPVIAELISLKEAGRRNNTPQDALEELTAWMEAHGGELPRGTFVKNGRFLTVSELTPAEAAEKRLNGKVHAMARKYAESQDPVILQLREILQNGSRRKTAGEWTAELEQWLAGHDGKLPRREPFKGEEITPQLQAENALARGVYNILYRAKIFPSPEAEALRRVWESGAVRVRRRTPEEWLEDFSVYLETHKHYPSKNTPEYAGIYNLLYRSAKTPDGKYANPVVQQIYEFDQLACAARRGELAWKDVALKEDSPLMPFWREASPRQREVLQITAREMEEMRDNFAEWVLYASENNWIVWDSLTEDVFAKLQQGLESWSGSRAEEADDIVAWLNETYWGEDDELDLFSRIRYKGDNPHTPKLKDFYELQEFKGFPALKKLPSISNVSFATKLFPDGEPRLKAMTLGAQTRPEDVRLALESVVPAGADFTFRMGPHELGVEGDSRRITRNFYQGRLHIHAEAPVPDEPIILSYTLEIDARALTRGKDISAIKRLYARLFRPYLSAGAQKFLSK